MPKDAGDGKSADKSDLAATAGEPASEDLKLGDEPLTSADTELLGPVDAPQFTLPDLAKVLQGATAADDRMTAAQTAKDEAAVKSARMNLYLSLFAWPRC